MRTSVRKLQILVVIIVFFTGWNTDVPKPIEEEKNIYNGFKYANGLVNDVEYTEELFDHPGFSISSSNYSQTTAEEATVKNYTFKVSHKEANKKVCMEIVKSGRKIRSDCADLTSSLAIVTVPDPGMDINGDGVPEVIVYEDTGEWHCCSNYAIFSLSKNLRLIDILHGDHSYILFRDLDSDGKYEVIGRDWTFAYWNSSFAGSPAPQLILRWKNGKYRLAEDLMKKPPPEKKDLLKIASGFKENAALKGGPKKLHWESEWWAVMLKLIYTGNGNLAWEFCDWFWPTAEEESLKKEFLKEKKLFLRDFRRQLKKSDYWTDLKKMNGW